MSADEIPRFFLYGEPPRAVGERFLHLESLDERSRPANWNIRPHAHTNLSHMFFISAGGGQMYADSDVIAFTAPCLLVTPCNVVHGFAFEAETVGFVVTVSDPYLQDVVGRAGELGAVFLAPSALPHRAGQFKGLLELLAHELAWTAPGHDAAVEALLVRMLVEALRLKHATDLDAPRHVGASAGLVARFRAAVEMRYRTETRVEVYAAALGVTPKRLRHACAKSAGTPPLRIIQDRLMLEAQRLMLYSNMTVSEVAYYLGFDDPAYFTRLFTRRCLRSPRAFRKTLGQV